MNKTGRIKLLKFNNALYIFEWIHCLRILLEQRNQAKIFDKNIYNIEDDLKFSHTNNIVSEKF